MSRISSISVGDSPYNEDLKTTEQAIPELTVIHLLYQTVRYPVSPKVVQ